MLRRCAAGRADGGMVTSRCWDGCSDLCTAPPLPQETGGLFFLSKGSLICKPSGRRQVTCGKRRCEFCKFPAGSPPSLRRHSGWPLHFQRRMERNILPLLTQMEDHCPKCLHKKWSAASPRPPTHMCLVWASDEYLGLLSHPRSLWAQGG